MAFVAQETEFYSSRAVPPPPVLYSSCQHKKKDEIRMVLNGIEKSKGLFREVFLNEFKEIE